MKKVENINLGGIKFTIDEDAFHELSRYMDAIERRFTGFDGKKDIVDDIEIRLAELFQEDKQGGDIISNSKLARIQKIMGMPKEFGDDYYAAETMTEHVQKRLFRDEDDKVVAGIASGLSAYYGINNPLLIRAVFVFFALGGIGILPYLLLWIFVPKAKTTADKLAMHGEAINIETIGTYVEDSISEIKETIEDLGKNFKKKMN